MQDTFDIYEWSLNKKKQSLEESEQRLQDINQELMATLDRASELAEQSNNLAKQFPDNAEPNFADLVSNKCEEIVAYILKS